jgi:hypothetical protein
MDITALFYCFHLLACIIFKLALLFPCRAGNCSVFIAVILSCLMFSCIPQKLKDCADIRNLLELVEKENATRTFHFFFRRVPQQKLRTHRSLEAYCATL